MDIIFELVKDDKHNAIKIKNDSYYICENIVYKMGYKKSSIKSKISKIPSIYKKRINNKNTYISVEGIFWLMYNCKFKKIKNYTFRELVNNYNNNNKNINTINNLKNQVDSLAKELEENKIKNNELLYEIYNSSNNPVYYNYSYETFTNL